jgi:hypothetical protein
MNISGFRGTELTEAHDRTNKHFQEINFDEFNEKIASLNLSRTAECCGKFKLTEFSAIRVGRNQILIHYYIHERRFSLAR